MMQRLLLLLFFVCPFTMMAQLPGDTVTVQTFQYGSTTRDTVVDFPNIPGVQFEKVLMLYNMRCKNGLVSPSTTGQTNIGCGEWDYSCNTYITDSSRADSSISSRASYVISNFQGASFPYVTSPTYNLYRYPQTQTSFNILSETQHTVGSGTLSLDQVIAVHKQSGRSQYLFKQSELLAAGLTAGPIAGFLLNASNSTQVHFLKVQMKHSTASALNAASPDTTGFTLTYDANTTFNTGSNRLQFSTPFVWDGLSNILVDFSCTNSTPGAALLLEGSSTSFISGLYANNGYYINTASGLNTSLPVGPLASLSNKITVTFWSRGDVGMSSLNSSIIEGVDASMNRQLNMHLPWSNANIYFDCGNDGSGYDRINALATTAQLEQKWNHWAFTKNATTGLMQIFLNGSLWLSGTGKTKWIATIDSIILGANINRTNAYHGDIDELTMWNTDLDSTTLQAWRNKSIDASHPFYSNLIAYYKLDEGSGALINDASVNAQSATFSFPADWRYIRGHKLFHFFTETSNRPAITFLQGTYTISNTNVLVYDSLPAAPHIVQKFTVLSNAGTFQSDTYSLVSTALDWLATYQYVYDGNTGALLDSLPLTPAGTINISSLPFIDRYYSKYELMSFVTPYGINLDLGMSGKTWTFDMTDFLPILKGKKRLTIERGGEWQENMDIKFLFLVGTPVRDVKDVIQIWHQPSNCNYAQIMNNTYFEPRQVPMLSSAKYFKIRSTITGHGQEGEFIPRVHTININGGADEFEWNLFTPCASNPVYPQGGTWIYDRCGWCPGKPSDLKEFDITPYVTPGVAAEIDYHMLPVISPAIGTSNYIVTEQLVSYGDFNFSLDAAVTDVFAPTNKIEYIRQQAICAGPKIEIQNTGSTPLNSLRIEYWVNQNTNRCVYNWTGHLNPLQKDTVFLPDAGLWVNVDSAGNDFHVEIKNPNGATDMYTYNNHMNTQFMITDVLPRDFVLYHRSNSAANETSYQILDEAGNVLLDRHGLANNTTYRDTMHLSFGCYKLLVVDSDNDGISFWNNSDGAGVMRIQRAGGSGTSVIKTFNPDFGSGFEYNFTIDFPLTYENLVAHTEVNLYPNPASSYVMLEAPDVHAQDFSLINALGQQVRVPVKEKENKLEIDTHGLASGLYLVLLHRGQETISRKLLID